MSELRDAFKDIDTKTEDLSDACAKLLDDWETLLYELYIYQDGLEPWNSARFKKVVLETYEYFKTFYERNSMIEEDFDRIPLNRDELELIARVHAYGTAEIFSPMPDEDGYYWYASYFIATALYETITCSNLRPYRYDQEIYAISDEFKYCSPDGEAFSFEYNVKTGDMTELVDLIRMFDELGWLYEKHRRRYIYTLPDSNFIEELKKSLEDDE